MRTKVILVLIISTLFGLADLFAQVKSDSVQINSDSIFDVAITQARNKDYNNAITNAKKVLEIHPDRKDVSEFIVNVHKWRANTDSVFNAAVNQAKNEEYNQAIKTANKVVERNPERQDVVIFIANVYAWKDKTDSAKIYIKKAEKLNNESAELYDSWLNILLWNAEYKNLLKTADVAEKHKYKNKYNLALKRLYAYKYLNEYDKGVKMFDNNKNQKLLDSTKINSLYREMLIKSSHHALSAFYSMDFFDDGITQIQHLAYVDYAIKIKKNTLIFRLNYAHRYNENGLQLEADYYHQLKKGKYLYFNYGASVLNDLFPLHRAGIEFYFPLKHHFEASVGARYMYFTGNHVPILTGHIGKYLNSYWFSLRPYYTIQDIGNSISLVFNARKYGKIAMNYWGLELGFGNSPDERYILDPTGEYFRLSSYRIKLERNIMIATKDELRISFGYAYEETIKSVFRNRYTIELIYKHRL